MHAKYSQMKPRLIIKRLPMMSPRRITVANPVKQGTASFKYSVWIPKPTAKIKKITPANVTRYKGRDEKVVIPIKASFHRLKYDQPDFPPLRATTSNGICNVLKPIHAVIPRKKPLRSRMASNGSAALRFISLKSEAPFSSKPERLFKMT